MDRLTAMQIFVRVVAEGSFSAAARALGMSKSAVSKYVSDLEDQLDARLLNRTTRRLSLTEVGSAYQDRCLQILDDIEEIEAAVSEQTRSPRGVLKVAAPVTFAVDHLGEPMSGFLRQHPEIEMELSLNDRRVDIIEEGFDLAIRIARQLDDSSLVAAKLATSRCLTVASAEYFSRRGIPNHPEELLDHNCLRYSNMGPVQEWTYTNKRGASIPVRIKGSISANNGEVLRHAAIDGQGIIAAPTFISGAAIKRGDLVPVLTEFEQQPFTIYAVYPHNRHLSAKVRRFVDYLKGYWGNPPPWDQFEVDDLPAKQAAK
ncbi:MAG: LysR family transcriptional regulator [Pseudomonadota bacterium]